MTDCIGHIVSFFPLVAGRKENALEGTNVFGVGLVPGSQEPGKLRVIVKQQSKRSLGKVDPVVDW